MALYYGRHKVADYDTWRPYFDGDQDRLASVGAKCVSVLRSTSDPNDVHFVFDVPDFPAFMGLMQTEETQQIMKDAGVMEMPSMYAMQELQPH